MARPVLTANSPSAGYFAWSTFSISYSGVVRAIVAGNTNKLYVYWLWNNGSPSTSLTVADALPALTDNDLLLFVNRNGIAVSVQGANVLEGSLIVNASIIGTALEAATITGDKVHAQTLNSGHVETRSLRAESLSISSYGEYVSINGGMDDMDPVTKVPSGWTPGFERTGAPTYAEDLTWPLIGFNSVKITMAANCLEGLAATATPCLGGDRIFFRAVFRASVIGVPVTLRAYFGTTPDFTRNELVGVTPPLPENIYIADAVGPTLRSDLPTPLCGPGIAACVENWPCPTATPMIIAGQFTAPAGARFVRFVLISGQPIGSGGSPAHSMTWDGIAYYPVTAGISMANGTITARELGSESVTTKALHATAMDGTVVTGATVQTAATGQRIVLDANAFQMFDAAGLPVVNLPTDPSLPAKFAGVIEADSLVVHDGFGLEGQINEISAGGVLVLAAGITQSGAAPTVTLDWPYASTATPDGNGGSAKNGVAPDSTRAGWVRCGSYYFTTRPVPDSGGLVIERYSLSGVFDSGWSSQISYGLEKVRGLTAIGTKLYTLSLNPQAGNYFVMIWDSVTGLTEGSWLYTPAGNERRPGIGTDGTNVLICFTVTDGANMNRPVWKTYNKTSGLFMSQVISTGYTSTRDMLGINISNFDFGVSRVMIHQSGWPNMVGFTAAGAGPAVEGFGFPTAAVNGTCWDATLSKFICHDSVAAKMYTMSDIKWSSGSGLWWASSTWTGGGHQTMQGPRASFTMKQRARLNITIPGYPAPSGGPPADDVSGANVFVGRGDTDPGRTVMEKQAAIASPTRLVTLNYASLPATALVPPPTANTFPNVAPAKITSANGTSLVLSGDGVVNARNITVFGEAWVIPALGNSWVTYGSGYHSQSYRMMPDGTVMLRGLIKSGTLGTAIFTLPVGYRPNLTVMFAVASASGLAQIKISNTGVVAVNVYSGGGANGSVFLDGVRFCVTS